MIYKYSIEVSTTKTIGKRGKGGHDARRVIFIKETFNMGYFHMQHLKIMRSVVPQRKDPNLASKYLKEGFLPFFQTIMSQLIK